MKPSLLEQLKRINPLSSQGIPSNTGNCQWCAIEGARVLLQGVEAQEIPDSEGGVDPIEEYVFETIPTTYLESSNYSDFHNEINALQKGEILMVSIS